MTPTERAQALEQALVDFHAKLVASQVEMPADAAKVLRENLWELYENDDPPPAGASPTTPDKRTTGLYAKFAVTRTDGSSAPGGKHDGCDYFVLDLTHDPHAIPALRAYAKGCRREYPLLADDIDRKLALMTGAFFQRQAGHE